MQTKNNITFIAFIVCYLLMSSSVIAQIQVSGLITDESDLPLIGAEVLVKSDGTGVITEIDGTYSISVPNANDTLIISYLGYATQNIVVSGRTLIDIVMQEESSVLDEVVVIGYGSAKKGDVTGSVAGVSSAQLQTRPVTRVEQALAGQMAGVRVRATTGDLGAPLQISIRGQSSISADNDPLYVVDGFPTDDISDLVIGDIADINVLKDASSAAIYGSRGANGVVIITTKSGAQGKPKFSFSSYYGLQQIEKRIDMMSAEEWIDAASELIDRSWVALGQQRGENFQATDSYQTRFDILGGHNNRYMPDRRWQYGQDSLTYIDWQDEMFQTAPIQEYRLAASGGSKDIKYHITGTYFDQEGIIPSTDFTRINFRSNLNIKFSPKLSMSMNLSPTASFANGGRVTGKDAQVHYALSLVPVVNKEAGVNTGVFPHPTYEYAGSPPSPIAYLKAITYRQEEFRNRANVALDYKVTDNLVLKLSGGFDGLAWKLQRYLPTNVARRNTNEPAGALSSALLDRRRSSSFLLQSTLNYNKKFGKHSVTALAGYAVESKEWDRTFQRHADFADDKLTTFDQASSTVEISFFQLNQDRLLSYFSRLQYSFDDRYLVSASIRRDGSSRFGSNNLWGTFPSLSFGWRVSNESFMEDISVISSLKLRASWGASGNNRIPLYLAYSGLSSSNYAFGSQVSQGLATSTLENQDLSWETTDSYNFGIDLGVLENRIFVSLDYYQKKTEDMLFNVPVATTTGFTKGWQNIGELENKGFEIELTTQNTVGKFKWKTNLNLSRNTNKVLSLGPDDTPILTGFQDRTQILEVGRPVFTYFMHEAIGVYMDQNDIENSATRPNSQPGDTKHRDVNGDGIIDINDKTYVGNPEPDFFWGITNTFSYKNLDLSVLLQGQVGGNIYGIIGRAIDIPGSYLHNRPSFWNDRWRSEESPGNGQVPRIDSNTGGVYDSRWLYDATYWKIKNVTLTYRLPKDLIGFINGGQIYFSGDNLFMVDNYDIGFSPEAENNAGGDYGGYPLSTVFTLGFKADF